MTHIIIPFQYGADSTYLRGQACWRFPEVRGTFKGSLLGTPNREPEEYSRNVMEYKDPGRYRNIPTTFLRFPVWGPQ